MSGIWILVILTRCFLIPYFVVFIVSATLLFLKMININAYDWSPEFSATFITCSSDKHVLGFEICFNIFLYSNFFGSGVCSKSYSNAGKLSYRFYMEFFFVHITPKETIALLYSNFLCV